MKIFELVIDENVEDESGVDYIALVDAPAIQSNWMAFNEQQKIEIEFKVQDEEKRIVSGYFMIADLPIARIDDEGKMFYVVFRKNTIEKIVNKFMRNGYNSNINLMHDSNEIAKGVYVIESLIVDSKRGVKAPKGFEKVPDGSWWGSMRVEDDKIWQQVKDGTFKGFSVEGMFGQERDYELPEKVIQKIKQVIKKYRESKKNKFVSMVVSNDLAIIDDRLAYSTQQKAEEMAINIGCEGFHTHEFEGKTWFMPCEKYINEEMYKKKCPKGYKKKSGKCVKMSNTKK